MTGRGEKETAAVSWGILMIGGVGQGMRSVGMREREGRQKSYFEVDSGRREKMRVKSRVFIRGRGGKTPESSMSQGS